MGLGNGFTKSSERLSGGERLCTILVTEVRDDICKGGSDGKSLAKSPRPKGHTDFHCAPTVNYSWQQT